LTTPLLTFVFLWLGSFLVLSLSLGSGSVLRVSAHSADISLAITALLNVDIRLPPTLCDWALYLMLFFCWDLELKPKKLWALKPKITRLWWLTVALTAFIYMGAWVCLLNQTGEQFKPLFSLAFSSTAIVIQTAHRKRPDEIGWRAIVLRVSHFKNMSSFPCWLFIPLLGGTRS